MFAAVYSKNEVAEVKGQMAVLTWVGWNRELKSFGDARAGAERIIRVKRAVDKEGEVGEKVFQAMGLCLCIRCIDSIHVDVNVP